MSSPLSEAPLLLALDTASPTVSVALARGSELLGERSMAMERSSVQLLGLVREVLAAAGARPADLGGVVALRGPGSFTGVRIGLATVLGLHQALGMRATALDTLRVLACACLPSPGGREGMGEGPGVRGILAVVDALRGDWSAQAFTAEPLPRPLGSDLLIPGQEIPTLVTGNPTEWIVTGFGVSRLAELPDWPPWPPTLRLVEAGPLAAAAVRLAADPELEWDASLLTSPLYARPPAVTLPKARRPPETPCP
jgi:tRNA threonylcarbamoyl adenosine modification protein YeaZ